MRKLLPGPVLILLALTACAAPDEPPMRMPAAITITHPVGSAPEQEIDADADGVCRTWGGNAALVERYENESRNSRVSAYNCVQE